MVEYSEFWFFVLVAIAVTFMTMAIVFGFRVIFAQEMDPNAYCLYKAYPYIQACEQQEYEKVCDLFFNASSWEMYTKLECMGNEMR